MGQLAAVLGLIGAEEDWVALVELTMALPREGAMALSAARRRPGHWRACH